MVAVDPPAHEASAPAAAPAPALKRSASTDRIPEDARRILHRLAGELWGGDVDPSALAVSQLKGAMTNEVFRITWPSGGGDQRKVLVRIYGQGVEVFFDRADEVRTFECMSRHGQGPRLLGRFPNGRVEEFINARVRRHAHRRADHQGHQRRAAEADDHLHRDAHAAAAALPRRAHQRARQRRLLPRHELHRQDRRQGGHDHHHRSAPAQRRRLRALPRPLLARLQKDDVLWDSL